MTPNNRTMTVRVVQLAKAIEISQEIKGAPARHLMQLKWRKSKIR
jgi:hypothetical protein